MKIFNILDIINDLEEISRLLYLESPETWIDFSDKVNSKTIDEMVLFYATKYNYTSIVKSVIENNLINLDGPSKIKTFPTIKSHLIAVAKEYNSVEVYKLLTNSDLTKKASNTTKTEAKQDIPRESTAKESVPKKETSCTFIYNCPTCNKNIFTEGYKVIEEVKFGYSSKTHKFEEVGRERMHSVICASCNKVVENVTTDIIEKMCSINNCSKCGEDLTSCGIEQKVKMVLDAKNSTFVPAGVTYVCSTCQEPLTKEQITIFKL